MTLGHSRVLYEIGPLGADLREVRARLGLDSGYLSRIVQALESEGLVKVHTDPADERVRRARLTRAGRAEVKEMNRRADQAAEAVLVATVDGEPVASGLVKTLSPKVGYFKRMWVAERMRGAGLGRRLLQALEGEARRLGFTTVRLETNRALTEAIHLYRRSGYREVAAFNDEPYAHHWFEKRLGGR